MSLVEGDVESNPATHHSSKACTRGPEAPWSCWWISKWFFIQISKCWFQMLNLFLIFKNVFDTTSLMFLQVRVFVLKLFMLVYYLRVRINYTVGSTEKLLHIRQNLGWVCNSRSDCMYATHFPCSLQIRPNLELKTRPKTTARFPTISYYAPFRSPTIKICHYIPCNGVPRKINS